MFTPLRSKKKDAFSYPYNANSYQLKTNSYLK